jgi:hypothetical protein
MTVNKLIVHPDYDKYHRQGSDIVLLQLHVPVEFNSHVLPACVPDNNTKFTLEKPCWISGWGMITEDSEYTGKAKRVGGCEAITGLSSTKTSSVHASKKICSFLNQNLGSLTLSHSGFQGPKGKIVSAGY